MLDYIYYMTLKYLKCIFGVKTSRVSLILRNVIMDVITFPVNLETTSGLTILLHGVISISEVSSWDKYLCFRACSEGSGARFQTNSFSRRLIKNKTTKVNSCSIHRFCLKRINVFISF